MSSNATVRSSSSSVDIRKGVWYGFIAFVIGFINCMAVISYYIRVKRKRGILDIFMLSFALSSILTSTAVIGIVAYVRASGKEYFVGIINECYVQYFFGTMLRMVDVATTTSIAIDRFIALYKPIFYRREARQMHGYVACALIWLSSAMIASLPIINVGNLSLAMESLCTADWTTDIAVVVVSVAYVELLIALFCYVGIFFTINSFVKRQKAMAKHTSVSFGRINPSFVQSITPSKSLSVMNEADASESDPTKNKQFFETEITDKLVQLSKTTLRSADGVTTEKTSPVETSFIARNKNDKLVQLFNSTMGSNSSRRDIKSRFHSFNQTINDRSVQKLRITPVEFRNNNGIHGEQLFEAEINDKLVLSFRKNTTAETTNNSTFIKIETKRCFEIEIKENVLQLSQEKSELKSSDIVFEADETMRATLKSQTSTIDRHHRPNGNLNAKINEPNRCVSFRKACDEKTLNLNSNGKINLIPTVHKSSSKKSPGVRKNLTILVRDKFNWKKIRRRNSEKQFWSESQYFAKVMGVVSLIFYVSWLPLAVSINFVLITGKKDEKARDILWICYNLSLLSSVAIPIAYAALSKPYRKPYQWMWNQIKRPFVCN